MVSLWRFTSLCLLILWALVLAGCGGSGGGSAAAATKIAISPTSVVLPLKGQQPFTATLDGSGTVVWSVQGASAGSITSSGIYTAPSAVGTYQVTASVKENPSLSATATVKVSDGAVVSVTPAAPSVEAGDQIKLAATVIGGSGTVQWSVQSGGGTIAQDGTYTAPATPGTYTVTASLADRPNSATTVQVTVTPAVAVSITSPASAITMAPKSTFAFVANVTNAADTSVTWTASGGAIASDGTYTAPDTAGTYTITATSNQNSKRTATQTVNVVADPKVRLSIQGKGDVVLQLDTENAPNTSANMASLVLKGFYDGIKFHRYVADFVIQGGDPLTKTLPLTDPSIGTGGPGYTIPFENSPLKHLKYALGMARGSDLNSAGSQFYICLDDLPSLDGQYVVFGKTIEGQSIVDELRVGDVITKATLEP